MNTPRSRPGHLATEYGIVLVLLVLCAVFSAATLAEQSPEGAAGGEELARRIVRDHPGKSVVVIVGHGRDDLAFADATRVGLELARQEALREKVRAENNAKLLQAIADELARKNEELQNVVTELRATGEGTVLLQAVVRTNGVATDISVVRSLEPALDDRAIVAVKQWRFAPGERAGQPVPVLVQIAVPFVLQ